MTDPIPRNPSSMNLGWDLDISVLTQFQRWFRYICTKGHHSIPFLREYLSLHTIRVVTSGSWTLDTDNANVKLWKGPCEPIIVQGDKGFYELIGEWWTRHLVQYLLIKTHCHTPRCDKKSCSKPGNGSGNGGKVFILKKPSVCRGTPYQSWEKLSDSIL